MSSVSAVLRRMAGLPPGCAPPDAELVAAHLAADSEALTLILERHGPAILRVCRAHLQPADADDAFQATVLVFLRDARHIRNPSALGGWLVRVADRICQKHHRNVARRRQTALSAEPFAPGVGPQELAAQAELPALVAAELARLPARLRAVVVLCALEDHSNTEAARVLGIPRGTVDSRLATAKERLRTRLVRRGLAPALIATLAPAATSGLAREVARLSLIFPTLTRTAAAVALAHGVSPIMSTAKLLALTVFGVGLAGTAGWGVYATHAGDKPGAPAGQKAEAHEPPANAELQAPDRIPPQPVAEAPKPATGEAKVRALLAKPSRMHSVRGITLDDVFKELESNGLIVRFDWPAFRRMQPVGVSEEVLYPLLKPDAKPLETRLDAMISDGGTYAELLGDILASLGTAEQKLSYRVRDNHVLIGPAYIPQQQLIRFIGNEESGYYSDWAKHVMVEQEMGPPVSVMFEDVPIKNVIAELRRQTGMNIVLHPKVRGNVTLTLDDVRLQSTLRIIEKLIGCELAEFENGWMLNPGPEG